MTGRIGIISFAHMHAYSYAACLQQLAGEAEIAGIFDENADRGRAASAQFEAPFFDDCDRLLSADLAGVVICTENAKHKDYTLRAAAAGKHVFCEKPISVSVPDAQAMIDACSEQQVQLMIAFPCRFSSVLARMKQIISSDTLGNILALKGTNRGTMPGGWFVDPALSGGGAVLDHTVHVVDVWRWMLKREVVSVYAESGRLFYPDLAADDAGLLSLEWEGGIFSTLDTSWSRPNASFPTWGDVTMEIVGERGTLAIDAFNQKIEIYNNPTVRTQWACWTDNLDLGLVQAFITMIRDGGGSPVSGYDGLKAMEVALAAYRSVETGQPVSLPLSA